MTVSLSLTLQHASRENAERGTAQQQPVSDNVKDHSPAPCIFQKVRRNIDDNTLIRRLRLDDRPVHLPRVNQHDIIRGKLVRTSLNTISDITIQQDQDLVKIVIVIGKLLFILIFQVK